MPTIQLVIVCVTVLLIILFAPRPARATPAAEVTAPSRVGQRATIHTKQPDDQTIFGVITGDYADRIVLEDAELIHSGGMQPLPGKQHIAVRDISWIDVHDMVAIANRAPEPAPAAAPAEE